MKRFPFPSFTFLFLLSPPTFKMLRSEDMSLILFFINRDTARHAITHIGHSRTIHFVDLNTKIKADRLPYTSQLKHLEKLKARIKFLVDEISDGECKVDCKTNKSYLSAEAEVNKHYNRYLSLKEICKDTDARVKEVTETVAVLEELERYLCVDIAPQSFEECLLNLDFVSFIVHKDKCVLVERVLKQVLRGNIILHKSEKGEFFIYLVFTHGKMAIEKIKQVVVSLQGRAVDDATVARGCLEARTRLSQIIKILQNNESAIKEEEEEIKRMLGVWKYVVDREIRVLTAMNKMRISHNMMVGEGWIMKKKVEKFKKICGYLSKKMGCISFQVLKTYTHNDHLYDQESEEDENSEHVTDSSTNNVNTEMPPLTNLDSNNLTSNTSIYVSSNLETNDSMHTHHGNSTSMKNMAEESVNLMDEVEFKLEEPTQPPTHFVTNKFTECFQGLTNVYGIPRFKEINPAIFQVAIFPFLFGMMFGDALHGLILLVIALYMIKKEKTMVVPEILQMVFDGRYALLVCAPWCIFFGLLYSDFGGLTIPLFPSQFNVHHDGVTKNPNYTYPFGVDPAWHKSEEVGTAFLNSYKMKLSIIVGFMHMSLGSCISILNSIYANDKPTLFLTIIPQFIIYVLFIGYMVFLIFHKWVVHHTQSILTIIIAMFSSPLNVPEPLYPFQDKVQLIIVSCILCMFPFSIVAKPIYIMRKKKRNVWMHQIIEGAEFGIGIISNTSSYLRLWAVSLAHSQLTKVINTQVFGLPWFALPIGLVVWVAATFLLLIGLEGMSASLHALRLNWIEFGGRFYKGDGKKFKPLDFNTEDSDEN